jgi:D-serine deaminase-like pyridoxal phosphate-dependent protein
VTAVPRCVSQIDTPAAIVDADVLEQNIGRMAHLATKAGVDLRPHVKTHKIPEIAHLQLEAGARGITVAKLGEAEVMVESGVDDIFVAYPIVGETKLDRLCRLADLVEVRVAADSWAVLEGISAAAVRHRLRIRVRLELDTGMGRCGLQSTEQAVELALRMSDLPGVELCGVMGFSGQSYAAANSGEIVEIARAEGAQVEETAHRLRELGLDAAEVSVGSTPTSQYASLMAGVTEIRPGTYVFSDRTMVGLGWGDFDDCALSVLTTVVSRPTPNRAVLDVGSKGLTNDPSPMQGFGTVQDNPDIKLSFLSEEHGVAWLPDGVRIQVGSRLRVIPNHACGTVNMFDHVYVVRGDNVLDRWDVAARGRMQ